MIFTNTGLVLHLVKSCTLFNVFFDLMKGAEIVTILMHFFFGHDLPIAYFYTNSSLRNIKDMID